MERTHRVGRVAAVVLAAETLAAAALFRPVLRAVQGRFDRRFNRARFDAVHEADEFAAQLRDAVASDEVAAGLLAVVDRTRQPAVVGIWAGSAR